MLDLACENLYGKTPLIMATKKKKNRYNRFFKRVDIGNSIWALKDYKNAFFYDKRDMKTISKRRIRSRIVSGALDIDRYKIEYDR